MRLLSLLFTSILATTAAASPNLGAWQTTRDDGVTGTLIITAHHFALAWYQPAKFISTEGGTWSAGDDGVITMSYEFHTSDPSLVGKSDTVRVTIADDVMSANGLKWKHLDDGSPGALQGAWLITGRKRDGQISTRRPGARRTMKILSGSRFQWIAYNIETKEFFGTGGGTYTTEGGRYTENIDFFSRDNSRAGNSLEFKYGLVDGTWHHDGKSTAGEAMYEVWEKREALGI